MQRTFWVTLVLLFLFVNEYASSFLLAIFVGDLGIFEAYERAFQHGSLDSYLMASGYRAIPFLALAAFAAISNTTSTRAGRMTIWAFALFISALHFYGYWTMQYSLFTPEHTSSTAVLAIIWVPIWALLLSVIGYVLIVAANFITRMVRKGT